MLRSKRFLPMQMGLYSTYHGIASVVRSRFEVQVSVSIALLDCFCSNLCSCSAKVGQTCKIPGRHFSTWLRGQQVIRQSQGNIPLTARSGGQGTVPMALKKRRFSSSVQNSYILPRIDPLRPVQFLTTKNLQQHTRFGKLQFCSNKGAPNKSERWLELKDKP